MPRLSSAVLNRYLHMPIVVIGVLLSLDAHTDAYGSHSEDSTMDTARFSIEQQKDVISITPHKKFKNDYAFRVVKVPILGPMFGLTREGSIKRYTVDDWRLDFKYPDRPYFDYAKLDYGLGVAMGRYIHIMKTTPDVSWLKEGRDKRLAKVAGEAAILADQLLNDLKTDGEIVPEIKSQITVSRIEELVEYLIKTNQMSCQAVACLAAYASKGFEITHIEKITTLEGHKLYKIVWILADSEQPKYYRTYISIDNKYLDLAIQQWRGKHSLASQQTLLLPNNQLLYKAQDGQTIVIEQHKKGRFSAKLYRLTIYKKLDGAVASTATMEIKKCDKVYSATKKLFDNKKPDASDYWQKWGDAIETVVALSIKNTPDKSPFLGADGKPNEMALKGLEDNQWLAYYESDQKRITLYGNYSRFWYWYTDQPNMLVEYNPWKIDYRYQKIIGLEDSENLLITYLTNIIKGAKSSKIITHVKGSGNGQQGSPLMGIKTDGDGKLSLYMPSKDSKKLRSQIYLRSIGLSSNKKRRKAALNIPVGNILILGFLP